MYLSPLLAASTRGVDCEPITTCSLVLWVSYDGGRFAGWSAANGIMRSVEGVLKERMAKLFGDVDPSRIVVEGMSRLDKGVHAHKMIAQTYCLSEDWESRGEQSIPGKRLPHPKNSSDTSSFVPFPMPPSKLVFVLNRMLPHDVSIRAVCPSPYRKGRPFHPTLDAASKTYQYTFSVGPIADPTRWRKSWHVGSSFNSSDIQLACGLLQGTHDFLAFRGAPRGKDDRRRQQQQSAVCTLSRVVFAEETVGDCPIPDLKTYKVMISGNRFLYKMVRFLVGCLVAVGQGKLSLADVEHAIQRGFFETNQKPECAPGNGLVLVEADYNMELNWIT